MTYQRRIKNADVSVDDIDSQILQYGYWYLNKNRVLGYINHVGVKTSLHRCVMEHVLGRRLETSEIVMFKDKNGFNCTRENLILTTREIVGATHKRHKHNSSGFKGVEKRNDSYVAYITRNKKRTRLGRFDTPEEAHAVYVEAAKKAWGDFSNSG